MQKTLKAAALAGLLAAPASAELVFVGLDYRTGPFAPGGIPFADGYADYFTLLNERDGGINGVPIRFIACETAYNTERGVECYENTKGENPLVYQPLSTGITYQLIPRATEDDIPLHTMGYGRTSASYGRVFTHVFNFPGTYWDAASIMVNYAGEMEGGMENLAGKTIALVYINIAYGREPIPTLEALAEKHGFNLLLLPVDAPGQEQRATWLQIRRERPDWTFMWGWGVMNQVALREASSVRYPMDRFVGIWWAASEQDTAPVGMDAAGYKAVTFHQVGDDFPIYDDLREYVVGRGKAAGDGSHLGTVLYSRGMVAAMWAAEAARNAMEIHGTTAITPGMMRDGYQSLVVDEERLIELGLPNFTVPVAVTCENHGGPGMGMIQQWDGERWSVISDFIGADREVIDPMIQADALAFAAENGITPRDCD
ncbi:MAG: ABC transporter permease [Rhodobacteraceae bacterium]|nr:MAG: ABC transporter permease [Paracoccaceae bacterium]